MKFSREGSISRIWMKNFMTYKNETIYPGPNFNVTVGPNGSGKSSIVTALSICLGGELKSLNRQADLESLINNEAGNKAAEIEIELFTKAKQNRVVKAVISKGKSEPSWYINGKAVNKQALHDLTQELQIQPGNLCQFLPQDVVREFPQMKPLQIFENTIKAVGDLEILNKFRKGAKIQVDNELIDDDLKTKQNTLASLEQQEKKLENEKKIMEEREELIERKKTIDGALKWEKFRTLRKTVKETRDRDRKLQDDIKNEKQALQPIQDFLTAYEEKLKEVKKGFDTAEKDLLKTGREVEEFEIVDLEDELDRQAEREREITQDETNRLQQKERITQEIAKLQEKIELNPLDPQLEGTLQEKKDTKIRREEQLNQKEQIEREQESAMAMLKKELNRLQQKKESLLSINDRKLKVLEKENPDTYHGVLWLRENMDKFKKKVHEPIMLCLNVKAEYARYIETHVGRADLEGFVCEDPDDVNLLLRELREVKRLRKINAFHSNPDPKETFRKRNEASLAPYGFKSFLSDMYDAPDAVNAYLCQQKNLHQVPLFEKESEETDKLKEMFCSYYIGTTKFTTKRSKYSSNLSTGIEDIGNRRLIRLSDSIDQNKLEEIEEEMGSKKKQLKNQEGRLKQTKDTLVKIRGLVRDINNEVLKLETTRKEFKALERDLKVKENMLKTLKEPKCNIEAEKKKIKAKKAELVVKLCHKIGRLRDMTADCSKLDLKKRCKLLQIQNVESENQDSINKRDELSKRLSDLEQEYVNTQEKFDREKKSLNEMHKDAERATGGVFSPDKKYMPPAEWQNRFNTLGTNDENVLTYMLDEVEASLKKKKVAEDTVKRINDNKKSLDKAHSEVEKLKRKSQENILELDRLRKGWIAGVRRIAQQVGDKFSDMMAGLGYAGQIELIEGSEGNVLDMKNYGIKIQVKFRNDDEYQELSKGTQSGGEKSVTTAVYMMALQGLTQVPFRCVDEINQGMDEKNERYVWKMLLDVCSKHQAQYFYMAPKFPYSLPFNDQVTLLICNSGTVSTDFSTKSYVEASRKI